MAKKSTIAIVGSLVALGIGGYFLWKKLSEDKVNGDIIPPPPPPPPPPFEEEIIIHYIHPDDAASAYKLRDLLREKGWSNIGVVYIPSNSAHEIINRLSSADIAITIGAQLVNPLYAEAVSKGIVLEVDPIETWFDWGCDNISGPGNLKFICYIGGWAKDDTSTAVRIFAEKSPFFNPS